MHNGTYTIESTRTGNHRTFSIKTQKPDAKFAPGKRIVALLTGPNNEADYTGFAFLNSDGIRVWSGKRGTDKFDVYARMLFDLAHNEQSNWLKMGFKLLCESRCIRCNRKLTTPDSIKFGIGPDCAEQMGIPSLKEAFKEAETLFSNQEKALV